MRKFIQRHQEEILGVRSGFDRIRFRGTLRLLQSEGGVATWLERMGVAVKDFLSFAEGLTKRFCRQTDRLAEAWGRKVRYLPGVVDKEDLVQQIREQDGVADNGAVAVLSTLEMGMSYNMFRRRDYDFSVLKRAPRKCKHYYFYWDDGRFGLTQVRRSSWFPFDVHVVPGGREWLARQMDAKGIGYLRRDNCFLQIGDFDGAQKLADQQPKIKWRGQLDRLLRRVHPLHTEFFGGAGALDYYWTSEQTEWATDVVFREAGSLSRLYQALIRRGIDTFQSPDVLRFLGHKLPAHGGVSGRYQGEVMSDLKQRAEGVRIKHRAGKNTVKMYNKEPTVLRVETTLNDGKGLKVYRTKQDAPDGKRQWLDLRKTVADLPRRARLSQSANERQSLYGETEDAMERRRQSGRVSRKLAMLRAHGLIKKIPRTHRYLLTEKGVKAITAILSARQASVAQWIAA